MEHIPAGLLPLVINVHVCYQLCHFLYWDPRPTCKLFKILILCTIEILQLSYIQAVCDHRYMFTNNIRWPGSVHDSRILRESSLGRMYQQGTGLFITVFFC